MKNTPTLEEVKAYFKDAKIVKCLCNGTETDITKNIIKDIHEGSGKFWITIKGHLGKHVLLHRKESGYAEVIERIEPTYTITKDQVQSLHRHGNSITKAFCTDTYPDCFPTVVELNTWYKSSHHEKMLIYPTSKNKSGYLYGYGFNTKGEFLIYKEENRSECLCNDSAAEYLIEATTQEVTDALTTEAKKRGFKLGSRITPLYSDGSKYFPEENSIDKPLIFFYKNGFLCVNGGVDYYRIFVNGIWAEIIPTLTKQQAEEKLNCKIV